MNNTVKEKCDLLFVNRDRIASEFKWDESLMQASAAMILTGADKETDIERLKECKKILHNNARALSSFRSTAETVVVCKMAQADDPAKFFEDLKKVYGPVSKAKFSDSGYIIQAAISICEAGRIDETDEIVAKFKELMQKMSKIHPVLTDSGDVIFAMLLALTDKPVDTIIETIEEGYNYLRQEVKIRISANEIQGLCEVLALTDGNMKEKCDKVVRIYNTFLNHGIRYGKEYNEFAALGALIDIDMDPEILFQEIMETEAYLKTHKGFGGLSMDKKLRLLFASMLVGDTYGMDSSAINGVALGSSLAAIIAEEIALMICVIAATSTVYVN